MKKFILLFTGILLSVSCFSQAGSATAARQDSLLKVTRQIRTDSYSGGFTSGGLLNSIANTNSNIDAWTYNTKLGVDTVNQNLRANKTVSVANNVTVNSLSTLATLAKQNQAITSLTISEGYLQSMEFGQVNTIQPNTTSIKLSSDTSNQNLRQLNSTNTNIKKGIDTLNQSLRVLNTTDAKTAFFTTSLSLTYSVANAFIQGSAGVNTFSLALGSNYYTLENFTFIDAGGNNGAQRGVYIMSDTINPVENMAITFTNLRWQKFLHYFADNVITLSNVGVYYNPTGTVSGAMENIYGVPTLFTGNVYFYFTAIASGNNLNGQVEYIKAVFIRKR